MRTRRTHQPLTYDVRLPDKAQADALRLLDASREVVNGALALLWPHLDDFQADRVGPAWKQVGRHGLPSHTVIGNGAVKARSSAACCVSSSTQAAFEQVLPILTDGFIRPETQQRPAGKQRVAIKEALSTYNTTWRGRNDLLRCKMSGACCNFFFAHDRFPWTYEDTTSATFEGRHAHVCRRRWARKRPGLSFSS